MSHSPRFLATLAVFFFVSALDFDAKSGTVFINNKENVKNKGVNDAYSFGADATTPDVKFNAANPAPDSGTWHSSTVDNEPKGGGNAMLSIYSKANPGAMLVVAPNAKTQVSFGYTFDNAKSKGGFAYGFLDAKDNLLKAEFVALNVVPVFNGPRVTLALENNSGANLVGSFSIYANPGVSTLLPTPGFDTLQPGAIPIVSNQSYSLSNGGEITGIAGSVPTGDYLLVVGTANDGSGDGPQPFASGAAAVPEPSTIILAVASGLTTLAGYSLSRQWSQTQTRKS
jgi:hypothetical protein